MVDTKQVRPGPYLRVTALNMEVIVHEDNSGENIVTGHKPFAGSILNFIYRAPVVFNDQFDALV
jgi:hypothetical protein